MRKWGLNLKKPRHNLFSVMITKVKDVFSCSCELVQSWSRYRSGSGPFLLSCSVSLVSPCYRFPANGSSCQDYSHYRLVLSILNYNKIAVWLFISVTFVPFSVHLFPLLCESIILSYSLSTHLSPDRH